MKLVISYGCSAWMDMKATPPGPVLVTEVGQESSLSAVSQGNKNSGFCCQS